MGVATFYSYDIPPKSLISLMETVWEMVVSRKFTKCTIIDYTVCSVSATCLHGSIHKKRYSYSHGEGEVNGMGWLLKMKVSFTKVTPKK